MRQKNHSCFVPGRHKVYTLLVCQGRIFCQIPVICSAHIQHSQIPADLTTCRTLTPKKDQKDHLDYIITLT